MSQELCEPLLQYHGRTGLKYVADGPFFINCFFRRYDNIDKLNAQ